MPSWAKNVALPRENWRETHLLDGNGENDGFQATVRIRPGGLIPLSEPIQHTGEYDPGTLTLLACPDKNGDADGWLYEDAGESFGYQKGHYALTHFRIRQIDQKAHVAAEQVEGDSRHAHADLDSALQRTMVSWSPPANSMAVLICYSLRKNADS